MSAATRHESPSSGVLYSQAFMALCSAVFLGFCCFAIVNPVIPVVILEMGGDAFLVGLLVAAYSIPSILLRPFMGRLVDEWSRWRVLVLGAAGLGLSSFGYLVPGLLAMAVVRLLNGSSFAAFNTSGNATLATLAPPARRGEAAAIYNLMPSLAYMIAPAVGLLLLGALGAGAAFLAAGLLGSAGALVISFGPLREPGPAVAPSRSGTWRNLLDRNALLPMTFEFLWVTTNVLFFVFPPVWADARGIPVAELAYYYPIVGGVLVVSRLVLGRRLDRWSRGAAILAGAAGGIVAIILAAAADNVAVLTLAGALYAGSSSLVSPTAAAVAIDRADPQRRGAAMATYSMGFPLGNGFGALLWGFIIAAFGFPAPFLIAILTMIVLAALVWPARGGLLTPHPSGS
jgi:MFS family permease